MKNLTRTVSESEAMKRKWEKRIMQEKNYSEIPPNGWHNIWKPYWTTCNTDMPSSHSTNKTGSQIVKATLRYYEAEFHKKYNPANVEAAVVYWDIDEQGWRTFQMENFLEWRVMG